MWSKNGHQALYLLNNLTMLMSKHICDESDFMYDSIQPHPDIGGLHKWRVGLMQ